MTGSERDDAEKYLQEVKQFRRSTEVNREDTQAANVKGVRFRYFVDANIAAFYLDPTNKLAYFWPLESWLVSTGLKIATSLLLAEFMFSGRLPGQQEDARVFMTPNHFGELGSMARAIEARLKKAERSTTLGREDIRERLRTSVRGNREVLARLEKNSQDYLQGNRDLSDMVADLRSSLPAALGENDDSLRGVATEASMLHRLVGHDMVVCAETKRWFHSGMFQPESGFVDQWVEDLRDPGRTDETKLHNDAISICQLLLLEREAPPDVKYVLISADGTIRNAYQRYEERCNKAGKKPLPLHLRHPRDYVPLINLLTMAKIDEAPEGPETEQFRKINKERSRIFVEIENALEWIPRGATYESLTGDWTERRDRAKSLWNDAAGMAVALGAKLLNARDNRANSFLEKVLESENVIEELLDQLNTTVSYIGQENARVLLRGMAGAVFLERTQAIRRANPERIARRAPLLFRMPLFHQFIGNDQINDYLDRLVRDEVKIPYESLAVETGEALLFGACVALAAEDWSSAHQLADEAVHRIEKRPGNNEEILLEASYCLAMAMRFTLDNRGALNRALDLLKRCIQEHGSRNQMFRLIRAESEAGSLIVTYLFKQLLKSGFQTTRAEIEKLSDIADGYIERAQEQISTHQYGSPKDNSDPLYQRIGLQAYGNRAALALFQAWVMEKDIRSKLSGLRQDARELRIRMLEWERTQRARGNQPIVPIAVRAIANLFPVLVGETADERGRAAVTARALFEQLLEKPMNLPEVDRLEYQFFLEQIDKRFRQGL